MLRALNRYNALKHMTNNKESGNILMYYEYLPNALSIKAVSKVLLHVSPPCALQV